MKSEHAAKFLSALKAGTVRAFATVRVGADADNLRPEDMIYQKVSEEESSILLWTDEQSGLRFVEFARLTGTTVVAVDYSQLDKLYAQYGSNEHYQQPLYARRPPLQVLSEEVLLEKLEAYRQWRRCVSQQPCSGNER